MNILGMELHKQFEEVEAYDFYKEIFQDELHHQELDEEGSMTPGQYVGIATRIHTYEKKNIEVETTSKKKDKGYKSHNFYLYDDLATIKDLIFQDRTPLQKNEMDRLTIVSPVSYAGGRRLAENARFLYALVVEIDGLDTTTNKDGSISQDGLYELLHQIEIERLPRPTFIIASGSGLHLYYQFVKPIPCFKNVQKSLWNYKKQLTKKLWNKYVTTLYQEKDIQYESVFQGFRMVGTRTKAGDVCEAYRTGEPVTIEYMNQWAAQKNQIKVIYKSDLTLSKAKELYPEWYEKVIINGDHSKKHWTCNRGLYDWWRDEISQKVSVGHRYYDLLCLSVYAIKCDIPYEELEKDAYSYFEQFEDLTVAEKNHFRIKDVEDALSIYRARNERLNFYSIAWIEKYCGFEIPRNKRNYRKQKEHLVIARGMKTLKMQIGEDVSGGRPNKQKIIQEWKAAHPGGTKYQCQKETGLSKNTISKWWETIILDLEK